MAKTLLQLGEDMDKLSVLIGLRARELSKHVARRVLQYLVRATPADTSKAVSNWRVAVAGTSYGAEAIEPYFPGQGGSTKAASAAEALQNANEALKGAQPGKALAIINKVPYLQRLNEGWSAQAPAGFIEAAILVGKYAVKEYNFNQRLKQDIKRGTVRSDG